MRAGLAVMLAVASCGRPLPSLEPLGGESPPEPSRAALRRAPRTPETEQDGAVTVTRVTDADAGAGAPASGVASSGAPAAQGTTESAEKPVPPGPSPVAGDYRGEDASTYRIEGMPERTEHDPSARTTVKAAGGVDWDFVLVDSSNGNEICTLHGVATGATVTIAPGQACFAQDSGDVAVTGSVTRGTAVFDGSRLVLDLTLDFTMRGPDGEMKGALDYHFEGTRR